MSETELFIKYLLSGNPLDFDQWKDLYEED